MSDKIVTAKLYSIDIFVYCNFPRFLNLSILYPECKLPNVFLIPRSRDGKQNVVLTDRYPFIHPCIGLDLHMSPVDY